MCFHNSLSIKAQDLEHRYSAKFMNSILFEPIYHGNAFNFIKWPIITNKNLNLIDEYNWGLIPSWIKNIDEAKKIKKLTLNAKTETVFEKPSFQNSVKTQRCIIPSTGFFEWKTNNSKVIGSQKIPYFIYLQTQKIFSIAGIYDEWTDYNTNQITKTFSILTTNANSLMEKIHNIKKRMPVILNPENELKWLTQEINPNNINQFCKPFDDKQMVAYTISNLVSSKNLNSNKIEVLKYYNYNKNNLQLEF